MPNVLQDKKYAFKCHRRNVDGKDVVFPVHCIAFHPGVYAGYYKSMGCLLPVMFAFWGLHQGACI